jgi:hypothetical protein
MIKKNQRKKTISFSYCRRIIFAYSYECPLSSDWDALAAGGNGLRCSSSVRTLGPVGVVSLGLLDAGLALEEAALLNGAAGLDAGDGSVVLRDVGSGAVYRGGEVGNVLGDGVLRANGTSVNAVTLAGLGHGIVARVEVLAILEMLGEVVRSGGQLAVEAEETLFLGSE